MAHDTSSPPVVLTCSQPNTQFHLGNFLGAISHWVDFQQGRECFYGLVDMHVLTMPYEPAELRRSVLTCAAQYIACGLDPQQCHIFVQSHVQGHAELAWILGCLASVGQLQRMTQFKDKAQRSGEIIRAGLLFYPVLQAADILIYNADIVPVGEDQKQHIELTRDLAQRFNTTYSDTFAIPEVFTPKSGARVMALQDPTKKMSKSDSNPNNSLFLLDPPTVLRKKIMSAVTDTGSDIIVHPDKPGISNLLNILSVLVGKPTAVLEAEFASQGYAAFKKVVADAVIATFEPVQQRYHQLIADKAYLQDVLRAGNRAAQHRVDKTMRKVYRKVGYPERLI